MSNSESFLGGDGGKGVVHVRAMDFSPEDQELSAGLTEDFAVVGTQITDSGEVNSAGDSSQAFVTKKRGRSVNWAPCELVAAFLARQFANRECGSQSKLLLRHEAATRAYAGLLEKLEQAGLCTWPDEGTNVQSSAKIRTGVQTQMTILFQGDKLRKALGPYCIAFSKIYQRVTKNGFEPGTGDNDGKLGWDETEKEIFHQSRASSDSPLKNIGGQLDACKLAFRIVCPQSPYKPKAHPELETYLDASYDLDPARRLDQSLVPTEKELRAHQKRRVKVAALDPAYGAAAPAAASSASESSAFQSELKHWFSVLEKHLQALDSDSESKAHTEELQKEVESLKREKIETDARLMRLEQALLSREPPCEGSVRKRATRRTPCDE